MKTPHKSKVDLAFVDDLLEARAAEVAAPSDAFLAKLQAQALAAQPAPPEIAPSKPSSGVGWLDAIGGWIGVGGLAAATLAGLWVGIAQPDGLSGVVSMFEAESLDVTLFASDSYLLEES